jgi:RNA polymerase sigma-70 factor (ECF subfamily)
VAERWDDPEWRRWEARCIEQARKGDRRAFAELYDAYAPELFRRILVPRLGNREAAEDALSETFRMLLERIDQYEDQGKTLWHWLSRVAANKATDMHRVKGRTSRALTSFEGLLAPLREGAPNPAHDVESVDERQKLVSAVSSVLDRINPRYRRAIELRFMEDKPREECAAVLEVKIGTFDVLILRALRAFRREWENEVGVET